MKVDIDKDRGEVRIDTRGISITVHVDGRVELIPPADMCMAFSGIPTHGYADTRFVLRPVPLPPPGDPA